MNPPPESPYRVVEMERTVDRGPGAKILFGLISHSPIAPLSASPPPEPVRPTPIFCLCFQHKRWDLIIDHHYNPALIGSIASNGACMGLGTLVKMAQKHANATYPNG